MTPGEYREKLLAELESSPPRKAGYGDFLNKALPAATRQASLRDASGGGSAEELSNLRKAALSPDEPEAIRASALQRLAADGKNSGETIETVLETLGNREAPASLRYAALGTLKLMLFVSPAMRARRSEYLEVLRSLAEDPDTKLREEALDLLAKRKDAYTQNLLLESLKGNRPLLMSRARTIQLLGYDIHSEVFPILRKLLEDSADEATAREAVRVLSADPSSAGFLQKLALDKKHTESVRRAGSIALQSLNPALFESVARAIALDPEASDGLRATSIQSLERFANRAALAVDKAFHEKLSEVVKEKPSALLERSVRRLQAKLPHK